MTSEMSQWAVDCSMRAQLRQERRGRRECSDELSAREAPATTPSAASAVSRHKMCILSKPDSGHECWLQLETCLMLRSSQGSTIHLPRWLAASESVVISILDRYYVTLCTANWWIFMKNCMLNFLQPHNVSKPAITCCFSVIWPTSCLTYSSPKVNTVLTTRLSVCRSCRPSVVQFLRIWVFLMCPFYKP